MTVSCLVTVFSQSYLSNGRAIGMVVIAVCLWPVCRGYIVAKRCEIGPRLLLIANRKSHIDFQMTDKSLTLDDLEES